MKPEPDYNQPYDEDNGCYPPKQEKASQDSRPAPCSAAVGLEVLEEYLKSEFGEERINRRYPYIWWHPYQRNWWIADDKGKSGIVGDFLQAVEALRRTKESRQNVQAIPPNERK